MKERPEVDWLVPVIGKELALQIEGEEDHHVVPDDAPVAAATVRRVRTVSMRYTDNPEHPVPVPGTAEIVEVGKGDGFYPEAERRGLTFLGYLVDIDVKAEG